MICLLSLIVFGILGIFSAKYRKLSKEAFSCVFLRIQLKPCDTGMDTRVKSKITSKLMRFPRLAKLWYRHFEIISWMFVLLMFGSFFFAVSGLYNLYAHGSCDPHSTSCIFNPGGTACGSDHCAEFGCDCETGECEAPDFKACDGNCTCLEDVCG